MARGKTKTFMKKEILMEETTKKKLRNYAFAEGYLRESYLEESTTKQGVACIKGDVVVSINRFNAQRIHVFAMATKFDGSKNKAYESLKSLIGDKIVTIASYINSLPQDGNDLELLDETVWDAATKVATKVWFSGTLEEYATISTDENGKEKETSSFSFRAGNGGIRKDNDKRAFNPRCNVELDGTILAIRDEQKRGEDDELTETGRLVLDYMWIDYKGTGHKFKLIAPADRISASSNGTFAEYVRDNYEVGQTALFNVVIVNLVEKKETGGKAVEGWGQVSQPTVITSFVHELRIFGGRSKEGFGEDHEAFVPKDEVTAASAKRRVTAKENYERSQARKAESSKKPEPQKGFGGAVFGNSIDDNFSVPGFSDF